MEREAAMKNNIYALKLDELRQDGIENEIVEFKAASEQYSFDKLGKYFSALSNEANLKEKHCAWLILGVENKKKSITGTNFKKSQASLNKLKHDLAEKTSNRITFHEIYEILTEAGRVLMFEIRPAPSGLPISFEGHYYGRDGESLSPLNIGEIEQIRGQLAIGDWSAAIVPDATVADLDPMALKVARNNYKSKFPDRSQEVDGWDNRKFLDKAKITIKGKITRAAILLLGREESEHFINPADAKIRWILKNANGGDKDYYIATCPFLLAVDEIYRRIRNLKYRYMQKGSLFPEEVDQYEPFTIREALNNCIAHQDYTLAGRINVIEKDDELIFTNVGSFIPGSVEKVVQDDSPAEIYRNTFLVTAMYNLKMVDTVGGGIRKMFNNQRVKFFPLPEYDLSDQKVKVSIIGKILDLDYAKLLAKNLNLGIEEIILLDKIQKKKKLTPHQIKFLKLKNLIEGRKPNFYFSQEVAQKTAQKSDYTRNRAFENKYYSDLTMGSIKQHSSMTRNEINQLLWEKLPEWMNDEQRTFKINNLIAKLSRTKKIINTGTTRNSQWKLTNSTFDQG